MTGVVTWTPAAAGVVPFTLLVETDEGSADLPFSVEVREEFIDTAMTDTADSAADEDSVAAAGGEDTGKSTPGGCGCESGGGAAGLWGVALWSVGRRRASTG